MLLNNWCQWNLKRILCAVLETHLLRAYLAHHELENVIIILETHNAA